MENHSWESETMTLITIYKALILSLIDYGSVIYNSAKLNIFSTFDPIYNQGVQIATEAFKTYKSYKNNFVQCRRTPTSTKTSKLYT